MSEVGDYWKPQLAKADATIDRLSAIITNERAEVSRLRKGIQDYLDGNYDHPRAHRHEPTKGCKHGRFYYEDCSECDSAYFSILLGETVHTATNKTADADA